jgi:hypothetical protein
MDRQTTVKNTVTVMAYSTEPAKDQDFRSWWGTVAGVPATEKKESVTKEWFLEVDGSEGSHRMGITKDEYTGFGEMGIGGEDSDVTLQEVVSEDMVNKYNSWSQSRKMAKQFVNRVIAEDFIPDGSKAKTDNMTKITLPDAEGFVRVKGTFCSYRDVLAHRHKRDDEDPYLDMPSRHAFQVTVGYEGSPEYEKVEVDEGEHPQDITRMVSDHIINQLVDFHTIGIIRVSECSRKIEEKGDCIV